MTVLGKWLVRIVLVLVVLCFLLVAAVALVFNTESGTRWAIARVDTALAGRLVISDFAGTLWSGVHIDSLSYTDTEQRLELLQLDFDLQWSSIALGRIVFENLSARSAMRTSLREAPPEPTPFELAMEPLPISVVVNNGSLRSLVLENGKARQSFDNIEFKKLRVVDNKFEVQSLQISNDLASISLADFAIRLANRVPTSGDIIWVLKDGDWRGEGAVNGNLAALSFQSTVLGDYPAVASGVATILDRVEPDYDVVVGWDLWVIADRDFRNGTAHLLGDASKFTASFDTAFVLDELQFELSGTAAGNVDELSELQARVVGRAGQLDLSGRLTRLPEFSATASATASNVDVSVLQSELTGMLDATADLSMDESGALAVHNFSVEGLLNGAAVNAHGDLFASAEQLRCAKCVAELGDNRITVDGHRSTDELMLSIAMNAPMLSQISNQLSGVAIGAGTIKGAIADPRVDGNLMLENFAYNNSDYGKILFEWQGSLSQARIDAEWRYLDFMLLAKGDIRIEADQINGMVREATITKDNLGNWSLQDPFTIGAVGRDVSASSSHWVGALGDIQISELSMADETFRAVATAREIPLELGNRLLPDNFQLSGTGSADVDVSLRAGMWDGRLQWQQDNTVVRVVEYDGNVVEIIVRRADAEVNLAAGGAAANAEIEVDPGVTGSVNVAIERFGIDTPMTGSLRLQGEDWSWMSAVLPQLDRFEGAISATIDANGALNAPEFVGTVEWQNGRVVVPSVNVQLRDISVVITGASGGDAIVAGSAKAAGGNIVVTGRLNDLTQATRSAQFAIKGDGAEMINWPEYHVWGSPDITLVGTADAWQVGGRLEIPRARFALREVPVGAVIISPDVVVLGEEDKVIAETKITGEARVVLGDDVRFEALGLDTRLTGNILFKQRDGRSLRAEGQVSLVDGSYAIHGQKLKIEQGELTFTGPLDDPIVSLRAVRVIETFDGPVTAGVNLRGRARELTTTLYSDPVMADADALSYLVFGRPLSQASESDGSELSGAAFALGLRQASRITDEIGQTLGLDQLSLAGDGGDTTALVAGKQINSRLHARYAYGVFSRLGTLLLRYKLSRTLILEAGAGENQSIDVLYSIEK